MELFEQLEFKEIPLYEGVINDLLSQKYSIVDDFFSPDEILTLRNSLLLKYEEDQFKKAAIGSKTNELIVRSIRGDFILWMDEKAQEEAEKLFFSKINEFANYLNKTCFLGILHKEFHYALYPEGTFYKRHLDTFQNDDRRKLSIALYLNEPNWQPEHGGELAIYLTEGAQENTIEILPKQGRMVIFESQELEHEVKTANKNRLSITGWLKTR
ncbi:oxidoreductase [Sediminicola sp. YIK13]|uniref:2OG-Fe(II) oxygenase n=1 Tax=Sediminicola sp. YIK13 TaxID=1453352 RepID=UPI000720A2BA|nr:2OG-Fe(II) oxygenase [Sediminicola sp. YIK13]ALM08552.1 oxidoreductase [Sediminicola sp. YIK13]